MKRIAMSCGAVAVIAACSLIALAQGQPMQRAHFSLAVRATSEEILVACDNGCTWRDLRLGATRTPAVFDDQGLISDQSDRVAGRDGFVISVSAIGNRLELEMQQRLQVEGHHLRAKIRRQTD